MWIFCFIEQTPSTYKCSGDNDDDEDIDGTEKDIQRQALKALLFSRCVRA